jgi:hypothetical protein
VSRFTSTVVQIALWFLPAGVGHCADVVGHQAEIAVATAPVRAAMVNMPAHAPDAGAPRGILDLRPPDLQSLHIPYVQQGVTPEFADEVAAITIAGAPLSERNGPDTPPFANGMAALVWAVHHPTQAWRVVLPTQPAANGTETEDRGGATERPTPETRPDQPEISANASPPTLASHSGGNSAGRIEPGDRT